MSATSQSFPRALPRSAQVFAALSLGLGSFFVFIIAWTLGYQLLYAGRIFPGVSVAGVDLSGLNPQEAAAKLNSTLTFPLSGKILFREHDKFWSASPVELGMVFDASASAQSAFEHGRSANPFRAIADQLGARRGGSNVSPVIIFDQRLAYAYINNLAAQVNQPVIEATLKIEGTNVIALPGQSGRLVDVDATLALLSAQLQTFHDFEIPLFVREDAPLIADVSSQAEAARNIISQPLFIVIPNAAVGDSGPWAFDQAFLASILTVKRVDVNGIPQIQVGLETGALVQALIPIAAQVDRKPKDARFYFDDPTAQLVLIEPSTLGRTTDVPASIDAINAALLRGEHSASLVVNEAKPAIADDATAESLGIREQIGTTQTTYFYGSSAERLQNIEIAAARFHGIFVAPGATFSMGEILGDVNLDNGFTEAWIIYGGRTIKGVGGGVCQVSTTLFRAAFFAGFPIVERYSHAYRVSYYERTAGGGRDSNLAGMDATVYFPLVDFKFVNDSPHWLLMETYYSANSLTWKFYSTSDGRSVTYDTTGPINVAPAPPALFEISTDLKKDQIMQVDWSANGADVTVTRTVWKNGAIYFTDIFQTHYEPWQAICQYGPGTEDPEKQAKNQDKCQPPGS